MSKRALVAAVATTLLWSLAPSATANNGASSSTTESGNPINDQGSSFNYRSTITSVSPPVPGLRLEVLEFADRLQLTNHTGQTVVVYGYSGEPYARVLPDGEVQVNTSSPAYYLNQNFYGNVDVPTSATPTTAPTWTARDRTGQLEWHDHRIHWMSPALPPEVKDKSKRTKVFDWQVPLRVGSKRVVVEGELFWVPEGNTKAPVAAIVSLVAVLLVGLAIVTLTRRRRRRTADGGGVDDPDQRTGGEDPRRRTAGEDPGRRTAGEDPGRRADGVGPGPRSDEDEAGEAW